MPRTTKSVTAKAKHKKVLSSTKGHYGARSRLYKTAKQSNIKSLQYAFRDRKNKKRSFRALWIARINAGARDLGVSYSALINSMSKKDIALDRKILSDIAISDSTTFKKIVKIEGIPGLYRGLLANYAKTFPTFAIQFYTLDKMKNLLKNET